MGHPWFSYDGAEINALWIKGLVDEKGWLRQLSNDDAFMGKICRYYRDYFSDVIEKEMDSTFPLVMYKIDRCILAAVSLCFAAGKRFFQTRDRNVFWLQCPVFVYLQNDLQEEEQGQIPCYGRQEYI